MPDYELVPLAGKYGAGMSAKVSPEDYEWASKHRWYVTTLGYVFRQERVADVPGDWRRRFVMLHREVMGFPEGHVHHVNGDKLDCRRSNLTVLTQAEHLAVHYEDGTSLPMSQRVRGVQRHGARWRARLKRGGRTIYLGSYPTYDEAALAVLEYVRQQG